MKRIIAIFIVGLMLVALCSCGSETANSEAENTGNSSAKSIEAKLGEQIEIGDIVFTFDRFEFADKLFYEVIDSTKGINPNYLLPTDEKINFNPYDSTSGKIYVSYSYILKYNGKEDFDIPYDFDAKLIYGDGYTFDSPSVATLSLKTNDLGYGYKYGGIKDSTITLKPLGDDIEVRCAFKVPEDIMNDTSQQLQLQFSIPNSDGVNTEVIYNAR